MRESIRRIAILGNHIPRRCGIATFTSDLAQSLQNSLLGADVDVFALNDGQTYDYPIRVKGSIDANDPQAYRELANQLNSAPYDLVCVQHEFGIFGGSSGNYLLELLRNLKMPIVTTLHTILEHPSEEQRLVFEEVLQLSERVVAMSRQGLQILREVYHVDEDSVEMIPHGIRDTDIARGRVVRNRYEIGGQPLILTFGLLSYDKGIQDMIAAMPMIVSNHPTAIYAIVGATHPKIKEREGESHREKLQKQASDLGVTENILFVDRFVSDRELAGWLAACDIYVTPYLKREQIVSGTLAYALGGGNAVVSTPYWYAAELLAGERGLLVPFNEPASLADSVRKLLGDPILRQRFAQKGFDFGRTMKWDEVGKSYVEVFEETIAQNAGMLRVLTTIDDKPRPTLHSILPSFDRLLSLTDSTGIRQHATGRFINRHEGYCTDDNARALELCLAARGLIHSSELDRLTDTYLEFVMHAYDPRISRFRNFMSYSRRWLDEGSDDCQGRDRKS